MLIIRRRLPSGQRRIIPLGGANCFASVRCQAEGLGSSRVDAVGRLSAVTGTQQDLYASLETTGQFARDILTSLETIRLFRIDAFSGLESQHATAIFADGLARIESVTQPVVDFIVRQEYGSAVTTDYSLQIQNINTLRQTDALGAVEAQLSVRAELFEQEESGGSARVTGDGILTLENISVLRTDYFVNAESVIRLRPVDAFANIATQRLFVLDVFPAQENVSQTILSVDALAKTESVFAIVGD